MVCPDQNPVSGAAQGPASESQAFCSLLCGLGLWPPPGKSWVSWDPVRGEACHQVRRGLHYLALGSSLHTGAQGGSLWAQNQVGGTS